MHVQTHAMERLWGPINLVSVGAQKLVMSYDITGGGPIEAPIVELSVPALKLIQSHLV